MPARTYAGAGAAGGTAAAMRISALLLLAAGTVASANPKAMDPIVGPEALVAETRAASLKQRG